MSIIKKAQEELLKELEDKKMRIVKNNLVEIKSLKQEVENLEKLNVSIEKGDKDEEYSLKERNILSLTSGDVTFSATGGSIIK